MIIRESRVRYGNHEYWWTRSLHYSGRYWVERLERLDKHTVR